MNETTFQGDGKVVCVPVVVNEKQTKPTNADRIRVMTDGELAELFETLQGVAFLWGIRKADGWLDWLRQEASE